MLSCFAESVNLARQIGVCLFYCRHGRRHCGQPGGHFLSPLSELKKDVRSATRAIYLSLSLSLFPAKYPNLYI